MAVMGRSKAPAAARERRTLAASSSGMESEGRPGAKRFFGAGLFPLCNEPVYPGIKVVPRALALMGKCSFD